MEKKELFKKLDETRSATDTLRLVKENIDVLREALVGVAKKGKKDLGD